MDHRFIQSNSSTESGGATSLRRDSSVEMLRRQRKGFTIARRVSWRPRCCSWDLGLVVQKLQGVSPDRRVSQRTGCQAIQDRRRHAVRGSCEPTQLGAGHARRPQESVPQLAATIREASEGRAVVGCERQRRSQEHARSAHPSRGLRLAILMAMARPDRQ